MNPLARWFSVLSLLLLAAPLAAQPTFTPLLLDGETSLEVDSSAGLDLGDASTIEFVIATAWEAEDGVEQFPAVLGRREPYAGDEPEGFAAATQYSVHLTPDRQAIGLFDGTRFASVPFDFSDGQLHHVALVTKAGRTTIYVDREMRGVVEVGLGEPSSLPLHVGSSDGGSELFMGVLPSLRLWRSALTAEQVAAIADVLGAPEDPAVDLDGLAAYSDFTGDEPEIVVLEEAEVPETAALPSTPPRAEAAEVESRGLKDSIKRKQLTSKQKNLNEAIHETSASRKTRTEQLARINARIDQYKGRKTVDGNRVDLGGWSFKVETVNVGGRVMGAAEAARKQKKLERRAQKIQRKIDDYTLQLDGAPAYGAQGARRGLRGKLAETETQLAALDVPNPRPPLQRTRAREDLAADAGGDGDAAEAAVPARPRRDFAKKPITDSELPQVGDVVQVGKSKRKLAVVKELKGGAFGDIFVVEDPQGEKSILKQQKAWPDGPDPRTGLNFYGDYKTRMEAYKSVVGRRAAKVLTPDELVEEASKHEVSMQNLASQRIKKLREQGEDVPDLVDDAELAGKGRIRQRFAGATFDGLFEDVDQIADDNVKEAGLRLMVGKMLQAAAALDRVDIVHRDLHAGNIALNGNGEIKLIDFGLAKRRGDRDMRLEATSGVGAMGEYGWGDAPEQNAARNVLYKKGATKAEVEAASELESSPKVDVYGIGKVMGAFPRITARPELADLMNDMMADDPAQRLSAAQALTRLRALDTGYEEDAETEIRGFTRNRVQRTLAEPAAGGAVAGAAAAPAPAARTRRETVFENAPDAPETLPARPPRRDTVFENVPEARPAQ